MAICSKLLSAFSRGGYSICPDMIEKMFTETQTIQNDTINITQPCIRIVYSSRTIGVDLRNRFTVIHMNVFDQ